MEFKVIETQEELDKVISARLSRENEKHKAELEKYADYEDLKQQVSSLTEERDNLQTSLKEKEESYTNFESQLSELTKETEKYKLSELRTKIAFESGIPFKLAERLSGEDEESLRADATALAELVKGDEYVAPLKDSEQTPNEDQAYLNLIKE